MRRDKEYIDYIDYIENEENVRRERMSVKGVSDAREWQEFTSRRNGTRGNGEKRRALFDTRMYAGQDRVEAHEQTTV
jgi:hypothetical protein